MFLYAVVSYNHSAYVTIDISRLCADRSFRLCGYTDAKARVSIIMNLIILSFFPQIFAKYGSETATG